MINVFLSDSSFKMIKKLTNYWIETKIEWKNNEEKCKQRWIERSNKLLINFNETNQRVKILICNKKLIFENTSSIINNYYRNGYKLKIHVRN